MKVILTVQENKWPTCKVKKLISTEQKKKEYEKHLHNNKDRKEEKKDHWENI